VSLEGLDRSALLPMSGINARFLREKTLIDLAVLCELLLYYLVPMQIILIRKRKKKM
jgi:hypothetical protein